ncbi:MAG TPA: outer membrane lipoprotein-sorting protein [Bacteroidota bacterium]|nr:outer membrane lipoprotein-sorting protein [Bacteroidota bacterium]
MRSESLHLVLLGCLIASSGLCRAQAKSGAEVLARCEKNMEGIEDYVVDLTAEVDMEGVRMPRMEATMYFKKPDKVHFESPNFAMLPREGFGTPVSLLIGRYDATLRGEEMIGDIPTHKLHLVAKDPAARLQQLYVWVNKSNSTVVRTESVPYQGRSVKMDFTYALQEGRYWLPSKMQVELKAPPVDTTDSVQPMAVPGAPQLGTMRRARRSGKITIEYSDYRINTGLSDELFKPQETDNP